MIKIALKNIDFGFEDLNTYMPEIPDNFCLWLGLSIGPEDIDGSHFFQVGVCTASWLSHKISREKSFILRHMLLVESFDFNLIKEKIQEIIKESERQNWEKSVEILCRYFSWEYEDYQQ